MHVEFNWNLVNTARYFGVEVSGLFLFVKSSYSLVPVVHIYKLVSFCLSLVVIAV